MRLPPSLAPALLVLLLGGGCGRNADSSLAAAQLQAREALDKTIRQAQEAYYEATGAYASDLGLLDLSSALEPDVQVTIRGAGANGWSASAVHTLLPTTPCIINVGEPSMYVALPRDPSARPTQGSREGEVACAEIDG